MIQKHLFTAAVIASLAILQPSGSAGAEQPTMDSGMALSLATDQHGEYERVLKRDLAVFRKSAAQLERYCENVLKDTSFLSRAGVETSLTSPQQLRGVYRFWASFSTQLDALEGISERWHRGWGNALFDSQVRQGFEGYFLGINAKISRLLAVSRLTHFLAKRKKLRSLFDEAVAEYKIPQGRLTHHALGAVSPGNVLALYQFHTSHQEDLGTFYGKRAQAGFRPVADSDGQLYRYFQGTRDILDGLILRIAKDPTWYKYAFGSLAEEAMNLISPMQESLFTWVGDTRIKKKQTRLIKPEQVDAMEQVMQPGDIIIERQNWYLSNVFLPGFWPHGALYIGDAHRLAAFLDADPAVKAYYAKRSFKGFLDWLQKTYPEKYNQYTASPEKSTHPPSVLEAISEGIVLNSLRHTCYADYVSVLRPRLPKLDIAKAIEAGFYYNGRPYDFAFDFYTESDLVCTEFVVKCYAPFRGKKGLVFQTETAMGKQAVRADEFIRTLIREKGTPKAQLEFVYFLRGIEKSGKAVVADQNALEESLNWRGGLPGPRH
ncbi:MAG TPA: YiiX/YebB-like N1pC/P60 family cysteine hydrolase [Candidatus Ozemobacteraceae bacterium]|nr:YiiX/YebB-like N1pC/P60 family cysteine hydrolase [Candidatus Ozemobacteraceae bacterium]